MFISQMPVLECILHENAVINLIHSDVSDSVGHSKLQHLLLRHAPDDQEPNANCANVLYHDTGKQAAILEEK